MVIVLAEKPSAARNFARALGGSAGAFDGCPYRIFALSGHLMSLSMPEEQVVEGKRERYGSWRAEALPWDPDDFAWRREFRDGRSRKLAGELRDALKEADEVAIATDDDPSGEGELLAWEALLWCGWDGPTTRMHFVDESGPSVRRAFRERAPLGGAEQDGDYLKAVARDRWDLLSMQLTRAATAAARSRGVNSVPRQGRLKSVMVKLVGDQQRAHDEYVRKPWYEPRFRDANGNVLAPAEDTGLRSDDEGEVDLSGLHASEVVVDSVGRRKVAPPQMLDLATLSGILATRGHRAADVLECYQRMYEDQIVSYPRTEDRCVTPEQFAELEPLVDDVARVVGVDPALLTHRTPRPTHVQEGGTHGANRPGPNVPDGIADLDRYGTCARDIYRSVARSFLATLAEDFEYDLAKAHVRDFPEFVGESRIPAVAGFRSIHDPDAEEGGHANERPWASPAEPFVHEGANKRPQAPTQRWLMRALERYEVGTGASRTSTFADACEGGERALVSESRGKLALTDCGRVSWTLLDGCDIASPTVTERLLGLMARVGDGQATVDEVTATVAPIVEHDLARMTANAANLEAPGATDALPCPRCAQPMRKARSGKLWFCTSAKGHRSDDGAWVVDDPGCGYRLLTGVCGKLLTDRQVAALLSGKRVHLTGMSTRAGRPFEADVVVDPASPYGTRLSFGKAPRGSRRGPARQDRV
jgi:DNA topoisomerase-3